MRILCDWDLVVAPADRDWLMYLCRVSGVNLYLPTDVKEVEYDLSLYFPDFEKDFGINPHSFWDNPHLYDTMGTVKGSAETLNFLANAGDKISIASHTKGGHFSSKYRHVTRVLKDVDFSRGSYNGFFATKEKYMIPCDVAIDDRAENLVLFPDEVMKIYFNTIYKDPYLEELKKLPNVVITDIQDPWGFIYHECLDILHK